MTLQPVVLPRGRRPGKGSAICVEGMGFGKAKDRTVMALASKAAAKLQKEMEDLRASGEL